MSQAAINKGKEIIKQQIRLAVRGEVVCIAAANEENLALFQRALNSFDIQRMLLQRGVSVELYIPNSPLEQAKNHLLNIITNVGDNIRQIIFPTLPQDYADYEIALASDEVQEALQQRGITASLQRVSQPREIVVATYEQVINGELDKILKQLS